MFMSVVELRAGGQIFSDLAGARVLITGLTSRSGVDVARAFAEHKARLVLQSPESSPEMTELAALLAETAADIKFYNDPVQSADEAVRLAQDAAQVHGGLDAVINIAAFENGDFAGMQTYTDVEDLVAAKLLPPTLITRVAANRMRLMLTEGSILNVVTCDAPKNEREMAAAGIVRATLASLTRGEAQAWAGEGIRINAIGPRGPAGETPTGATLNCEPDIAVLALYLASRKGRQHSGHVFDAEGASSRSH